MTRTLRRFTSRQDWVYALALGILAAIPRLYQLDLAEFKLDEANHYRMAYFLLRGSWRWVGSTSSVGLPKPPLFIYTLALPLTLSRDPRVVTGFLGVLAALAVGALYLVLRRFLSKKAAFGAALLFALNPQAVLYARKLFTADLLPPLCTLFLAAGIAFLRSPRRRIGPLATLVAFTFVLLTLTTFSPLLLLPALALLFWERRCDLRPLHWFSATAALILPFAPYLIAVAPRFSAVLAGGGEPSPTSPSLLLNWMWGLLYGSPWPEDLLSVAGAVAITLLTLTLAGLLFLLNKAREKEGGDQARFLLAWLCLSPLLAVIAPVEVHAHYFVLLYPPMFVLPAAGVDLAARKSRALGWMALLLLGITVVWQIQVWGNMLNAAATGSKGYGTPVGYWWRAAERARDLAEQEGASEILLSMPGDHRWDEKANILDALLSDTPHRLVDGYTTAVFPPHSAILLIASEVTDPATLVLPCTRNLDDLPASPLGGTYHYRLWSPNDPDASLCTQALSPAHARWASGTLLLGYNVVGAPRPGESLQVTLHWETTQGPLDADVHWFNHLEDREGQRWGQVDLVGWPASRWQPGDRVLVHFDLPIASEARPGPYVLRMGQYTYPEIENIPVVDAAGNPADYAIALPVPAQ